MDARLAVSKPASEPVWLAMQREGREADPTETRQRPSTGGETGTIGSNQLRWQPLEDHED